MSAPRAHVRVTVYLGEHKIGPGKIELLEAIDEAGSISAAARAMGMAYRHAWEMVDDLNRCFRRPVTAAMTGGKAGGGAALTDFGRELVARFRAMEAESGAATRAGLRFLQNQSLPDD